MSGNSFGKLLVVTTAGESHGKANVVIIDGLPAGLPVSEEDINKELSRRKPGQSHLTTPRCESDQAEILSGLFQGKTLGTPMAIIIPNRDARSQDYDQIEDLFRPGHAEQSYFQKFTHYDYRGGGRASARETTARVAAGALAKKILCLVGMDVIGYTVQIGHIIMPKIGPKKLNTKTIERSLVRCPDLKSSALMEKLVLQSMEEGDSVGGVAEIVVRGVMPGLGNPIFDRIKADLAKALYSIPAVVGVEFGIGHKAASLKGSDLRRPLEKVRGQKKLLFRTKDNPHGGIVGGITTGEDILIRIYLKPPSSIAKPIATLNKKGKKVKLALKGRHDPCLLPRFIPVGEAMVALTLVDHLLQYSGIKELQKRLQ